MKGSSFKMTILFNSAKCFSVKLAMQDQKNDLNTSANS